MYITQKYNYFGGKEVCTANGKTNKKGRKKHHKAEGSITT
jgi:hypothetical protein